MERKKTKSSEPADEKQIPLWRRKLDVAGKLYLRTPGMDPKRPIKRGQLIYATPDQLGTAITQFDLVEGDVNLKKEIEKRQAPKAKQEGFQVVHISSGWYNVVSEDGKVMNDKKLRADDAEELKETLEQEQDQ